MNTCLQRSQAPVTLALSIGIALMGAGCTGLLPGDTPPALPSGLATGQAIEVPLSTATAPPATPTAVPTPAQALDPAHLWVGVEGTAATVADVSPEGSVRAVPLPLNTGELASDPVAGTGGHLLAYLVWEGETQRGIAVWELSQPEAQMVAAPQPGYRIISLALAADGETLAFVQMSTEAAPAAADWRLEVVSLAGEEARLLSGRENLNIAPPVLIGWPAGGDLLLGPAVPGMDSQSYYAVDAETGESSLLVTLEGQAVAPPVLSPDGTRLACLVRGTDEPGSVFAASRVTLFDLRLGEIVTMPAPDGLAVAGVRWLPDGQRLLLSLVRPVPDDPGEVTRIWGLAAAGQTAGWQLSVPLTGGTELFDFEPLGEGVAYTVIPVSATWQLYLLPALSGAGGPVAVQLDPLAQEFGAPVILYTPYLTGTEQD